MGVFKAWVQSARTTMRDPRFHQLLRWCLPALLAGLALRLALTIQLPYGYIQYDSSDYLFTPFRWIRNHDIVIHGKRSFLVPVLYTIPFLLHLPALIVIPLAQHFMGLVQIVLTGVLVRLWFNRWKWFVIPATLLVGCSPWILWFEHSLMGESLYLFFLVSSVLAGTLWARNRTPTNFVLFFLMLVLLTGTRGEAKLLFLFGMLLVLLVLWGKWKQIGIYAGTMGIAAIIFQSVHESANAAPYLYASVIQFTPDHIRCDPELEPVILPLRDAFRTQWTDYPADTVKSVKVIQDAVKEYAARKIAVTGTGNSIALSNRLLKSLSAEALRNQPLQVLLLPFTKFHLAIDSWSSGTFDKEYLHDKQSYACTRKPVQFLLRNLTHHDISKAGVREFFEQHYSPEKVAWFVSYQNAWHEATIHFRLPDEPVRQKRWVHDFTGGVPGGKDVMPGMPLFYLLALAGMAVAMLRPSPLRRLQIAWVPSLLFIIYAVHMVGNATPRYRFAYEPFFLIYFLLLFDCLFAWRLPKRRASL